MAFFRKAYPANLTGQRWLFAGILFLVFGWIAAATVSQWPGEIFNYDLIHDLTNGRALLEEGRLPVHGSVASYGVFNPPGPSYALAVGQLLFRGEPMLAMRVMTVLLSLLTVVGMYLLMGKRWGAPLALAACLLYLVSQTGWYFMAEMRPRAHPVFAIWILFFLERLIVEQRPRAVGMVVFLCGAGLYWMLEIAPLVLTVGIILLVYRPPIRWKWLWAGAGAVVLLWMPYLQLQWERDFQDLRTLVWEREAAHPIARYFHEQLREAELSRVRGYRPHTIPGYERKEEGNPPPAKAAGAAMPAETGIVPRIYHFPEMIWNWLAIPVLLLVPVAVLLRLVLGMRNRKQPSCGVEQARDLVWIVAIVCAGLLFLLTMGESAVVVERRFLWIWVLWVPGLVLACDFIIRGSVFRKSRKAMGVATEAVAFGVLIAGLSVNGMAMEKSGAWISRGFAMAEAGPFRKVIDEAASLVLESGLEPRIGYDLPFLAWIPAVHAIDGQSRIGIQYDLMLEYRYGIKNLTTNPLSVSAGDTIRIVEHDSAQPWRQSYLDLSGFPAMKRYRDINGYTVVIRPEAIPEEK